MANNITGAIWRIDTVPFAYPWGVKIVNVNWTEAATVGDQMVLLTTDGRTIIDSKCNQVNYDQNFGWQGWFPTGVKATVLTSGIILIAIGAGR